jgi:MoxR-like ATPase
MQVERPEAARLLGNLEQVVFGKREELTQVVICLLSGGHLLVEDVPGVGKTTLARALARSVELEYRRVQFTPDLMPTDIIGATVLRPGDRQFEFVPGPVFTQVLLADEINRASPRTQSALLEAMSEGQTTSDGVTRPLPRPFFVIATQNPAEYEGTYPLPEAQLDRFLMRIALGYPSAEQELQMVYAQRAQHPIERIEAVADGPALQEMSTAVRAVTVDEKVGRYMVDVVRRTREHPDLLLGGSPRAALGLFRASQARAWLAGRDFVMPDDVQAIVEPVVSHRVMLRPQARYAGRTQRQIVADLLREVPVPV